MHALTAITTSIGEDVRRHNRCVDRACRRRWGVTFKTFKAIKAVTQLLGVVAGIYAMTQGADPTFAFVLITLIWGGPELLEVAVSATNNDD